MSEEKILSHPAKIRLMPHDRASLLAKAREFVGEDLADDEIFTFRAEISNDQLDSHFTHMAESTLTNYAADAQEGVAFLRGHNWRELPIGYSMNGLLEDVQGRKRVVSDFYTVRGLSDTNDLIHRISTKLVRDVSVGFGGGYMRCDICQLDFWECRHWPGLKYEVKDGDTMREMLATFTIEDARLSEVSGVFDGSTPQAMILKAERFAAAGLLSSEEAYKLERQYRVALPLKRSFAGVDIKPEPKGEETVDEKQLARLKEICINAGMLPEGERESFDVEVGLVLVDKMAARLQEQKSLVDDGRTYRKDLIDEAIRQGVRLYGNDFKAESYRSMLEASPLEMIRTTSEDWKRAADKGLTAGRQSQQDEEAPTKKFVSQEPDEAYA